MLQGCFQTKWLFGVVYFTGSYHGVKVGDEERQDKGEKTLEKGIFLSQVTEEAATFS